MVLKGEKTGWRKHGVLLKPEVLPGRVNGNGCACQPLGKDRWRVWFGTPTAVGPTIGYADVDVRNQSRQMTMVELDESKSDDARLAIIGLPDGWRPRHPGYLHLKDGLHRLYFWVSAPGIVRYLAADSEDGRVYHVVDPHKACLYHPHDRAVERNNVPDGLTAVGNLGLERPKNEPAAPADLVTNDATNVYQLPDGSFELFTAVLEPMAETDPGYVEYDNARGYRRFIRRYISRDGLAWTDSCDVLRPDEHDPPDLQFYYLAVTHIPQGRIGILGHYQCAQQTIDMEWCFSTDGVHWQRPARGPWLERGSASEPDSYATMAGHRLEQYEGHWWLAYTGYNFSHNHQHSYGPQASRIMLASLDRLPLDHATEASKQPAIQR